MKEESLKKIANDLKKSGIPLEIKVLQTASKFNCGRLPNYRFFYNNVVNEIDLIVRIHDTKVNKIGESIDICSELSIECKKRYRNPWVFFKVDEYLGSKYEDFFCHINCITDYNEENASIEESLFLNFIEKKTTFHHYSDSNIPKCINYVEAYENENKGSSIYKACRNAIDYIRYNRKLLYSEYDSSEYDENLKVDFYYPVVVLQGELLEAKLKNDDIILKEVPYIQLRSFFEDDIYIIDIVKEEYFDTYLDSVRHSHNSLVNSIVKIEFDIDLCERINCLEEANEETLRKYGVDYSHLRIPTKGGRRRLKKFK